MSNKALIFLPAGSGLPGAEERHAERLRQAAPAYDWRLCRSSEEFERELPAAAAALVWAFPEKYVEIAKSLRLLATPAAGKDWVAARPGPNLQIIFGSFHGELMAETALGLVLAFTRGVKESIDRAGDVWPRDEIAVGMRPLRGSHAVILGFGHIGKWIGRLLAPLGVRLTGVNRRDLTEPDYFRAGDRVIPLTKLDDVLAEAQHLICVLPGGPESENALDERRLGLLPPGAFVYNLGRGNAVDLAALEAGIRSGRIAGAGLDVFPEEPLPARAAIRDCPRVIRLPHVSAFGPNYLDLFLDEFTMKIGGK